MRDIRLTCKNKSPKLSRCQGCGDFEDRIETLENSTAQMKDKLDTIETGAEVNVQSNWTENDSSSDAYILNKPTIDNAMSDSSTNAVQNNVIKAYVDAHGDKNYVYTQSTPASTWEIIHTLGKYPAVSILDTNDDVMIGEVHYNSPDKVTLTFSEAVAGRATLN